MTVAQHQDLLQMLIYRLERVPVDSHLAHVASGVRGTLLKTLDRIEKGNTISDDKIEEAITSGYQILERAARDTNATPKT